MNININRNKYIKPIFISIGAALFVFALGFGIMNIHWYLYSSNDSLPGLYDYYAVPNPVSNGKKIPSPIVAA